MPMPYELRSPEDIAMEYGGNKQKIGAAVQAGLLDPTAGVLAGMFIDRMRNAAVEEQAPTTTVAQDTMSPRPAPVAPSAGLAAMQPQGVPAPGAGAVPAGPAMPTPMPQGMARGGLTMLDVPDTMYDYGMGGIVAFAEGDAVEDRLRLLPVDNLADAYVFLQERGAEIPEDMSEEAVIDYANRVREMENMEIRDSGVRVPSEPTPAQITPFGAPRVDYGRAADPTRVEEMRLDMTPEMPMGGGEYAPGFEMQAPTQRGLPGLMAPEGPVPERAVPFLGQMMEAITPTAEASEFKDGATVVTPEQARAELAEIAPDWYDAGGRSDIQVVRDLEGFKERMARRPRREETTTPEDEKEASGFSPKSIRERIMSGIGGLAETLTADKPLVSPRTSVLAIPAVTELAQNIDQVRSQPYGSVQMDEIQRMFPTMETSVAPSAAQDEADFLNKNYLGRKVEEYSLSPKMPTAAEMGFRAAEIPPEATETPDAGLGAITPKPGQVSDPKLAGLFGDEKAKNMALLELGARLMAGQSPYALQNLGTAATGTLQSIREQQKAASDRLLKERMLQIEEAKAGKEKDTDERNRLRILQTGTPKERAALERIMEQEQEVARARLGLTGERYSQQAREKALEQAMKDIDIIQAKAEAAEDPSKRAAYNALLEERIAQYMGTGTLSTGLGNISPSLMEGYGGGSIFTKSGQM